MEIKTDATHITIKLPIVKRPSKSGKSTVIASTFGNQVTTATVDGKPVTVGVNAYIR